MKHVISVSELTLYIKELVESDENMCGIWVRGEMSNSKRHSSGHRYFTLKDQRASLRCVMFRSWASSLRFIPQDGMEVLAYGSMGVYERDGNYQMYVQRLEPYGTGSLYIAFEQLKKRLEAEGLFDSARKRPLPAFPQRVAVITSRSGAAIRDILSVSQRRCPCCTVVVFPVSVQGDAAVPEMLKALAAVEVHGPFDAVIIGRGGGSQEELWCFNDEALARAIACCSFPVVSAVGHETDYTIADFVADVRAPTPSAAAELVFPDRTELLRQVEHLRQRLRSAVMKRVERYNERLRWLSSRPVLSRPAASLKGHVQRVDDLEHRLRISVERRLESARGALYAAASKLDALSPLGVLTRGYTITLKRPEGRLITRPGDVVPGDRLATLFRHGEIVSLVEEVLGND
ncbi:MAG: exodeoxyribonuclease VII large subunit [Bacillota bacterium]